VFDYKFRDYLLSIGYDKENSNQVNKKCKYERNSVQDCYLSKINYKKAINYLQDSFDGSLDLEDLKQFFNSFTNTSWNFKSDMHLKKLLDCSLMPGNKVFLNIYLILVKQ
jgi:hypothetical protein